MNFRFLSTVAVACAAVFTLCAAPKDSDPEVLSTKGGKRNYTGVYPDHVKTIAVITPGSYPNPKNANRAINLLAKPVTKSKSTPMCSTVPKAWRKTVIFPARSNCG